MVTADGIAKFLNKRGISVAAITEGENGFVVFTDSPSDAANVFAGLPGNGNIIFVQAVHPKPTLWQRIVRLVKK